jgi:hypothetical protein
MVDLHTHSTASDGTLTPEELVAAAAEQGIRVLALTDHDTVAGVVRAQHAAKSHGITVLPGCELEISFTGGTFHLLALGVDPANRGLLRSLQYVADERTSRNLRMVTRLREAGIDANYEAIGAFAGGAVVGRPHFARYLVDVGYVGSTEEAFHSYLGEGKPFHEQRKTLSLGTALSVVHGAGGIAVVAHPRTLHLDPRSLRRELFKWKQRGLDGLETRHANCPEELSQTYERLAQEVGLYTTAGSDYHGPDHRARQLGETMGGIPIADRFLPEPLRTRLGLTGRTAQRGDGGRDAAGHGHD